MSKLPPLFIGRFQPFHLGHLDALEQIFAAEDYCIIGIGSTEDDYTPANPFTAGERYQMIEAAILGKKIGGKTITRENFTILPVRNIHHFSLWVKHLESLLPPFGDVYTGSPLTARLFKEAPPQRGPGSHQIKKLEFHQHISATEIRGAILAGKSWEKLVPDGVSQLIKKWDAVSRLKEIQQ